MAGSVGVTGFDGSVIVSLGSNHSVVTKTTLFAYGQYNSESEQRIDVTGLLNGGFVNVGNQVVAGQTSGAFGTLVQFVNSLGYVFICLKDITGVFVNGEPLLMTDSAGVTTIRGTSVTVSALGFDTSESYGPRLILSDVTPNGAISAPAGSFCFVTSGSIGPFVNTDGGTTWVTTR